MQKLYVLVLLALLAGAGIIALIEQDPGYVLIAFGNYTVETSLWIGLLALTLFAALVYLATRLWRRLAAGLFSGNRRMRAGARLTTRGQISFTEGNWEKARRQLLRGARYSEAPLPNYLMAARASFRLGQAEKMHEYLAAAESAAAEADVAVELTQAELWLGAGQYQQALATLERARSHTARHPRVLDLLQRVYRGLRDWQALQQLLPELKKYRVLGEADVAALEREIHSHLLTASAAAAAADSGESLRHTWQRVPTHLQQEPALLHHYVALLIRAGGFAAAEKVILRALKRQWDPVLVRQYAFVQADDSAKQLAHAEAWLPAHPEDAGLLLCLGRLAAREKLWGKARDYFESSYRIASTPEVCAELGRLLLALGETGVAGAYYREGLQLRETALPELPMPEKVTPAARRLAHSEADTS